MILIPGCNPGKMTLQGTNTYLLGTGQKRILLDTGEGKEEYFNQLQQKLNQEKCQISIILITHHHSDHTGGIDQVLSLCPKADVYKNLDYNLVQDKLYNYKPLQDGQQFQVDGYSIMAISQPGHCSDHFSFMGSDHTWFSGDCFLGGSSCFIENYRQYLQSMEKILEMEISNVQPGHGYPVYENPKEAILKQIQHRKNREQQIYQATNGKSLDEITQAVYPDLNDEQLLNFARMNVKTNLIKLVEDNSVVVKGELFYKQ